MTIAWNNTINRYRRLSVYLHWLMLLLIIATYAAMDLKTIYPKGSPAREAMALWHYTLGLSVFCLVWLRLWARITGADPEIIPALPEWQALSAKVMHWALYVLMIGLPILGWLTLSARGKPVPFFGAELPALVGKSREWAKSFKEIHENVATMGYFLVGLHATAALFHHYVKRDNTLRLMLLSR